MQTPIHLPFWMGRKRYHWMGGGCVEKWRTKVFKNNHRYIVLKVDVTCVCSFFQVIKMCQLACMYSIWDNSHMSTKKSVIAINVICIIPCPQKPLPHTSVCLSQRYLNVISYPITLLSETAPTRTGPDKFIVLWCERNRWWHLVNYYYLYNHCHVSNLTFKVGVCCYTWT